MEDIKSAVKKAKKEEKQNPEYLYRLGLRFKNGEGTGVDMFKAAKYFKKAGKIGSADAHKEHALFWWKTLKDYYYSEIYFKKAAEAGCEDANALLEEMMSEKAQREALKAMKKSSAVKKNSELYELPLPTDSKLTAFLKSRSLVRCPSCGGKLKVTKSESTGELTEQYMEIHDKGTCFEKRYGPYTRPTYSGVTETHMTECEECKLSFIKTVHTALTVKDAEPTWKEILTENNRTEWWKNVTVSYEADKKETPVKALNVLKKSAGKYEEKYI